MADAVSVTFSAQIGALIDGVSQVKSAIESVQESTDKISDGFKTLAEVAGVSLSIEGVKNFVEGMASLGERTVLSMARLGESAGQITTLSGVAKIAGVEFDGLQSDIERFSLNVQKAAKDGFSPAAQGLRVLGLNAKELTGIPTEEWILKLSDAVSKFNPSLNLTNAVMAAGGRGVAEMLPLLIQGSAHFRELEEAVRATGATLTNVQAQAFDQTHEKLTLLGLSVEGVGIKLFTILKPAIDSAAVSIRNWLQSLKIEDVASGVTAVANFMIDLAGAVAKFFIGVKERIDEAKASINNFTVDISATTANVLRAITTVAVGAESSKEAFGEWGTAVHYGGETAEQGILLAHAAAGRASAGIDKMAEDAKTSFAKLTAEGVASAHAVGDAFSQTGKQNAGPLNLGGAGAAGAAVAQIEGEVKAAQTAYQTQEELLKSQLKDHQITQQQMTAATISAVNTREDAELAALNSEEAVNGLTAAQFAKIENEKTQVYLKAIQDRQKANEAALQAEVKQWDSILQPIQSAWNSQLRGLLSGTETFSQAFKKILADLLISFIEWCEKQVTQWAVTQLAMATVSATAGKAATNLPAIAGDVGQAFAGFAAFLAPVMGPAAIPTALGMATAMGTEATALASADVGGYVLSDGVANIHAGETIVPAQLSQPYSGGASGGGNTTQFHFNGPVIGTQAWINSMMPQLSRALNGYQGLNPSQA